MSDEILDLHVLDIISKAKIVLRTEEKQVDCMNIQVRLKLS